MGTLAQKLSQVPGVGLVTVGGSQNPSIRIQLNRAQLAAMNLDFETVRLALANLTVVQPTGLLYGGQQAVVLQTNDQLMTAQGFDDAIGPIAPGARFASATWRWMVLQLNTASASLANR